jgi:hypothetical protein
MNLIGRDGRMDGRDGRTDAQTTLALFTPIGTINRSEIPKK